MIDKPTEEPDIATRKWLVEYYAYNEDGDDRLLGDSAVIEAKTLEEAAKAAKAQACRQINENFDHDDFETVHQDGSSWEEEYSDWDDGPVAEGREGEKIIGHWEVTREVKGDKDGTVVVNKIDSSEDSDTEATPLVEGKFKIEFGSDEDSLIKSINGNSSCEHKWRLDFERSAGGTVMVRWQHCRLCGLRQRSKSAGEGYNNGSTVCYQQPRFWCAECKTAEQSECSCKEDEDVGEDE